MGFAIFELTDGGTVYIKPSSVVSITQYKNLKYVIVNCEGGSYSHVNATLDYVSDTLAEVAAIHCA